jgi:hypothetical protein
MTSRRSAIVEKPYLLAGVGYVALHFTLLVTLAWVFDSDPGSLASSAVPSLGYYVLISAFGIVLVAVSLPRLDRVWWAVAAVALLVLFGGRYVIGEAAGLYSVVAVFTLVFLPYVVAAGVIARLIVVRLPVTRLAAAPRHRASIGALLITGVLLTGTIGGSVVAVATAPPAVPPDDWSADRQLAYLERTDQADRRTGALVDRSRDYQRAERVLALLRSGRVDSPESQLNAAIVLQHGSCAEHFELAHRLATAANESPDVDATQWVRVTYDRWQVAMGNEQRYGTQTGTRRAGEECHPPIPEGLDVSTPLS